jgi:sugar phosphate isomerase/epimerase
MYFTGFADEASPDIDLQIKATRELGWKHIETRALYGSKLSDISDAHFEELQAKLEHSGVSFNCYGSGIANWSQPVNEPPDASYEEMRKAIPRMRKLGIKYVRMMSYEVLPGLDMEDFAEEVFKRVRVLAEMAEDGGVLCLHENCMNWAGQSYEHTLRLLDAVKSPALKLVYDTGNPVFSDDVRGAEPYKKQSSWEFYSNVKEFIEYVHIKDGIWNEDEQNTLYTFPGEGNGDVRAIVKDLLENGYDGGFSMEPHMKSVFHSDEKKEADEFAYKNYVEYGQKFMKLINEIKKEQRGK